MGTRTKPVRSSGIGHGRLPVYTTTSNRHAVPAYRSLEDFCSAVADFRHRISEKLIEAFVYSRPNYADTVCIIDCGIPATALRESWATAVPIVAGYNFAGCA